MISAPNRYVALGVAVLAAAGLAACTSSSSTTPSTGGSSSAPKFGGTLNVVAAAGPDHLDTVPAYYSADYEFEHAYTRQMLQYPSTDYNTNSDAGWTADVTPVPDIATAVPTVANGGITNNGMTYTFHIKPGVYWDTTPPRQVTADDFIREFKAFCNPAPGGFVGNVTYYASTIHGLNSYCNAELAYFANAQAHPATAANITAFQNQNGISGLSAPDPLTLQINLIAPAGDFIYMMAMPFTSARPVEYDAYLPNSLQLDQHTISDGPYQISSYIPGKSMTLVRNPAWKASTDSLRKAYVDKIVLTIGVTSPQTQLSDMQAGTEDVTNDTPLNPALLPALETSGNPNFKIWPWSSTQPYIVFNLRSPDANAAMNKLLVRQAVEYGLNKIAVRKAYGGPQVGPIINTVIPPGNAGYQNYNLYPDDNGQGDVAVCKSDLAQAGYPNGVTVLYMYQNDSTNTRAFEAIQASLAQCGIRLTSKPEPGSSFFVDTGNSPVNNKPNQWDMAQVSWIPDWFGNNGRTMIQALFAPRCTVNTNNYGCYNNPTVNSLITQAEAATSLSAAAADWHRADMQIMQDAVIVPMLDQGFPNFSSARTRHVLFQPNIGEVDLTNLWLSRLTCARGSARNGPPHSAAYPEESRPAMPHAITLIRSASLSSVAEYAYAATAPAGSRLIFLAGACPLNEDGTTAAAGDYAGQAAKAFENMRIALADAGASAEDVLSTRVLVASSRQEDLVAAWDVIRDAFGSHDVPSTLMGVTALGYKDQLVEIEAVAAVLDS